MTIYPAIDIIDGKCVRLKMGDYSQKTVFGDDPVAVAKEWERLGAKFIHIVDLDGARSGDMPNFDLISKIAKSVSAKIEVGGGIRDMTAVDRYLEAGVRRVILGTAALRNPAFARAAAQKYGDRVAVGIDAKDGKVAVSGWEEVSSADAAEFAKEMERAGVKTIIYTDIATDGMLSGPNLKAMEEMVNAVDIDVVASGGVSKIEDVAALKKTGVEGAIIGKALYTKDIDLSRALAEAENTEKDVKHMDIIKADFIKDLKFDKDGLIPAVAQDSVSGEVLMLAYMNADSIRETIKTGHATYFSRSRQQLWEKGATSGNFQDVVEMYVDCDQDAIVLKVKQTGNACHTNNHSCFYRRVKDGKLEEIPTGTAAKPGILYDVYNVIVDRVNHPKKGSYTNYLFDKGIDKMLKKVGEEASEVIIASKNYVKSEVQYETADLLYHLSVVLVEQGLTWDDIFVELQKRYK